MPISPWQRLGSSRCVVRVVYDAASRLSSFWMQRVCTAHPKPVCACLQVEAEEDTPHEQNGSIRSSGSDGGAAMAACEALVSLTCLSEAKLAIVKQHPQVRRRVDEVDEGHALTNGQVCKRRR